MNKNSLDTLLAELYALDPSLVTREKELRQILEKVLESKPNVPIDEQFVSRLRSELLQKETKQNPFTLFFSSMKQSRMYVGAGALAIVVVAIGLALNNNKTLLSTESSVSYQADSAQIALLGKSAFGALTSDSKNNTPFNGVVSGRGGGGGGSSVAQPTVATDAQKMIAPAPYQYSFTYKGDPITITENTLPVYRRVGGQSGENISSLLRNKNFGIDLTRFGNVRPQSLYLLQNGGDNYSISVDFIEGKITVNPQYDKWYPVQCDTNGVCNNPPQLALNDVPNDEKIISVANNFLKNYGVDTSLYGTPKVDSSWKQGMAIMESTQPQYVPDVIGVIYPISIDGKEIFEMSGEPFGMHVNVDIRKMKAQGVWNLNVEKYEASPYEVETDVSKIIALAERGALGGNWYGASTQNVKLDIGTPERVSIPYYRYDAQKQTNQELYIPALRFPVMNPPSDQPYFQKYVVVPLVKEILKDYENINQPIPVDSPILLKDSPVKPEVQGIRAPDAGDTVDPNRRY